MNQRGSPRDILSRLVRIRCDVFQMLQDVRSVNDNSPHFAEEPMDVGRYIVQLRDIDRVIVNVRALVESGATTLPNGILDPILSDY